MSANAGTCHRYSPYDRRPSHTHGRLPAASSEPATTATAPTAAIVNDHRMPATYVVATATSSPPAGSIQRGTRWAHRSACNAMRHPAEMASARASVSKWATSNDPNARSSSDAAITATRARSGRRSRRSTSGHSR